MGIPERAFKKTMHWKSFNEKPSTLNPTLKGGIHSIETFKAAEAKIVALMCRIEALKVKVLHMSTKLIKFSRPAVSTVKL